MPPTLAEPASTSAGPIIHEPAEAYHAQADKYLSSHQLADFRRCPLLYYKKKAGLIPDEDRPAYVIGRALHTLVLEGRGTFEAEYAVGGPINERTGKPYGAQTKAFAEWAASHGKQVLTDAQSELVEKMAAGVRAHPLAMELLSSGEPECVVRAEYRGMPCQIRIDHFDVHRALIDLKTVDDTDHFEVDAKRYGYIYQMAFYRAVLRQVISLPMPVYFIAVEKKEPLRCGVWRVDEDVLNQAQRENEAAIERLKLCQETNTWPTGYAEMRVFDLI
jgi:hypothetical protein